MDLLSPQDASFLDIEDEISHMHIGSVGIFEGPPPGREEVLEAVSSKLHLVPRYRQKVRYPPLHAGPPAWIDDPHFNLSYHVRRTALPSPGGEDELRTLTGRVMSQQLDRSKPLWEMWLAEGLDEGRWALISKVHHCMVDGVSATDLLSVLLDSERDPEPACAPVWQPQPEPSAAELLAQPLARRLASPASAASAIGALVRGPRQVAELARQTVQGTLAMSGMLRPTPRSSLNGPIGPHRRWDWGNVQLTEVKAVRKALGGRVDDVVLTIISHGVRQLLLPRD